MEWAYTEKVKEHFTNPKNILKDEEEYKEDGRGQVGNPRCGDMMLVVIKIKDNIITECKWKTYGCASAIASTSAMSEMVVGMSLGEAYKVTPQDILKELDGLPPHKVHCSVMGDNGLRAAIDNYYERQGEDPDEGEDDEIICYCLNVVRKDIKDSAKSGESFEELQERTQVATACGQCEEKVKEIFEKNKG